MIWRKAPLDKSALGVRDLEESALENSILDKGTLEESALVSTYNRVSGYPLAC